MAKVTVAHHPELTTETVKEVFRRHFGERYDVYTIGPRRSRGLVVKKRAWTGVMVGLRQEENATAFVLMPAMPSRLLMVLLACLGLIPYLLATGVFLRPSWKAMEREVRSFIENAPEFK